MIKSTNDHLAQSHSFTKKSIQFYLNNSCNNKYIKFNFIYFTHLKTIRKNIYLKLL